MKSDCLVLLSFPETPVETLSFPIQLRCENTECIEVLIEPGALTSPWALLQIQVQTQWVQSLHLQLPGGAGADDAGLGM